MKRSLARSTLAILFFCIALFLAFGMARSIYLGENESFSLFWMAVSNPFAALEYPTVIFTSFGSFVVQLIFVWLPFFIGKRMWAVRVRVNGDDERIEIGN